MIRPRKRPRDAAAAGKGERGVPPVPSGKRTGKKAPAPFKSSPDGTDREPGSSAPFHRPEEAKLAPDRTEPAATAERGRVRLNRFLASAGLGSRRACESLIQDGRVTVNGRRVHDLATWVRPGDEVRVDNRAVRPAAIVTLALNKPPGFICSRRAEGRFRPVFELLPPEYQHANYIGRLDAESEGLLLFTSDGALAQKIAHPRHHVEKEYFVQLDQPIDAERDARRLTRGMAIEGRPARFESLHPVGPNQYRIVLRQGLKRQIRVMFGYLGRDVVKLRRIRVGALTLDRLRLGHWKVLSAREIGLALSGAAEAGAGGGARGSGPRGGGGPRRNAARPGRRSDRSD